MTSEFLASKAIASVRIFLDHTETATCTGFGAYCAECERLTVPMWEAREALINFGQKEQAK